MSGTQIVAVFSWLSFIAAPWYAIASGRAITPAGLLLVMGVSAAVGVGAGLYHQGVITRENKRTDERLGLITANVAALERLDQQKAEGARPTSSDAFMDELQRAALSRMSGGSRVTEA